MTKFIAVDLGSASARVMLVQSDAEQRVTELARFSHTAKEEEGALRWQTEHLFFLVRHAIDEALKDNVIDGIGICSWGVDYAVVGADGKIVEEPLSYRDPRCEAAFDLLHHKNKVLDERALYELSGIFPNPINTIYRLYDDVKTNRLPDGCKIAMVADLLAYRLTGRLAIERSNASTTGLLAVDGINWNYPLIAWLGIDKNLFPDLLSAGERYGTYCKVPVFAVCTHDTASAIVAMGQMDDESAFLSSGSWLLVGRLQDDATVTNDAFAARYTNEHGYDNKVTFLNNINGLFVVQSLQRELGVSYKDIDSNMDAAKVLGVVDVNLLMTDGEVKNGMLQQLGLASAASFDLVKTAYYSLAANVAMAIKQLATITRKPIKKLYITGGATKAPYFMSELSSQTALKIVTVSGEGAVMGNAMVQLKGLQNGY